MSNIDYCRLPSIPCSMRTGNTKSHFPNKPDTCNLFNPDQVNKMFSGKTDIGNINNYKICYKDYPKEGRAGDYFCQLNDLGKCVGKPVDCDPNKNQRRKDKERVNFDIPDDVKCMPPNTKGCKNVLSDEDAKLYINGRPFYQCQTKDGEVDEMCISNLYASSQFGLPIDQSTPDPPDRNILYTERYQKPIRNKKIISCPTGYNICGELCCENKKTLNCDSELDIHGVNPGWKQTGGCKGHGKQEPKNNKTCTEFVNDLNTSGYCYCNDGSKHYYDCGQKRDGKTCRDICGKKPKKCIPPEHQTILGSPYPHCDFGNNITNMFVEGAPHLDQFRTEKQCLDWCAKNPDCKATVNYLDRNGKLQCRYYKYDTKDNRIHKIDDKTGLIHNRRVHPYVPNPSEKILPKYDFASIPVNKKTSKRGNLIDGCAPYGCCADGSKKADKDGKNCKPFTTESGLVGDPYEPYQYSSLGGKGKMGGINELSGNAYIDY